MKKRATIRSILLKSLIAWLCCNSLSLSAQNEVVTKKINTNISFQHLSTENGLSYIGVNSLCLDKEGNLWIATGNGLNMFNGKTIEKYYTAEYPQFQNNNMLQVICDDQNRIWVLTEKGNVTMLDEQRRIHRVGLYNNEKNFVPTDNILNTQSQGVILYTKSGHFHFNGNLLLSKDDSLTRKDFIQIGIKGFDTLYPKRFRHIFKFDDDTYFFSLYEAFFKVNYKTGTVEAKYDISYGNLLAKWSDDSVLHYDLYKKRLEVLNYKTGKPSYVFDELRDQSGQKIKGIFIYAAKINKDQYLLTTKRDGIYIYNTATHKIYNYTHNVSDPSSLTNNTPTEFAYSDNGWVFIINNPNGVNYFNNNAIIGNQYIFQDKNGRSYDGHITGIITDDNDHYYLGSANGLIKWERSTNISTFPEYYDEKSKPLLQNEEIQTLCFDQQKRIWLSTTTKGLLVIDKNGKLIRRIRDNNEDKKSIKQKKIYSLQLSPGGYIWAGGADGVCRINPTTFEVDNMENTVFAKFDKEFISPIFFQDSSNIWFGVSDIDKGVAHYNFSTKTLTEYTKDNGIASNVIFSINQDRYRNIYIGTSLGMNILTPDGRVKTITTKDGLLIPRVEALLPDEQDHMWIGNDIGLACYHIKDSSVMAFDERYGLSIYGFRVNAYYQNSDGEFIFGTPKGLQYFYPGDLFKQKINLKASISRIETQDVVSNITDTDTFKLSSNDNYVTFNFSSVDYSSHLNTFYEYKLEGVDVNWIKVVDQNSVRYSSLPPGQYEFKLRVSNNNKTWYDASNSVFIDIAYPFWQTSWFKLCIMTTGLGIIWYVISFYKKRQQQQREELETEVVINYFASQINRHRNTDALLWDVARNCIGKLKFEDCVIYLLDKERNLLMQKAAYGPKNPIDFTINQPLEIPVGKGIVGAVALTGKPELINNTAADRRYIIDDAKRNSEIAVPLIIDEQVIGVIDSEHRKRNFFTQKHLGILTTVALLVTTHLQRIWTEQEKQNARLEVLKNKQKATESRLQNLRLQMNPHFLFNALNSIQQMILANEELVATKYLSKFSKLLRAILIQSDKEAITLKEELEILKLYVELESIRFKDSFKYQVCCDEEIDTEEVKVPALLIQPFVENAIWHGLMHKEGARLLQVNFTEDGDYIKCTIDDNGIGRKKASDLKLNSNHDKKHKSKGIEVSEERLKTLTTTNGNEGFITIIDKTDASGLPAGTTIQINIPIQN